MPAAARGDPKKPANATAEQHRQKAAYHSRLGGCAVPYSESASGALPKCALEQPGQQTARAFYENAAASAHSRLPMHTAVVAEYRHYTAGAALARPSAARKTGQSCRRYSYPKHPEKQKRKEAPPGNLETQT
ncbi:MAG: hypothetical protein ACLVJH_00325 [Faecalibacterium prausnitzii]